MFTKLEQKQENNALVNKLASLEWQVFIFGGNVVLSLLLYGLTDDETKKMHIRNM